MSDEDKKKVSFVLDYLALSKAKIDLWVPKDRKAFEEAVRLLTTLK